MKLALHTHNLSNRIEMCAHTTHAYVPQRNAGCWPEIDDCASPVRRRRSSSSSSNTEKDHVLGALAKPSAFLARSCAASRICVCAATRAHTRNGIGMRARKCRLGKRSRTPCVRVTCMHIFLAPSSNAADGRRRELLSSGAHVRKSEITFVLCAAVCGQSKVGGLSQSTCG